MHVSFERVDGNCHRCTLLTACESAAEGRTTVSFCSMKNNVSCNSFVLKSHKMKGSSTKMDVLIHSALIALHG